MRGDRHWRTARSHNHHRARPRRSRGLTARQQAVGLASIGNRGVAREESMNPQAQRAHTTRVAALELPMTVSDAPVPEPGS
jgi:hypothetical protein